VRPTPHIYAYNRELSAYGGASSSVSASSESSRCVRASSEAAFDRSSAVRSTRATSLAPQPGTSLSGYTGYFGRQLAMMKEAEEHRKSESAASSKTAVAASSAASKSVTASMKSTSVQQTVERQETSVQRSLEEKRVSFQRDQARSLEEGRRSMSRAVRRAEYHAETSGKDPRHVGVPRNVSDDICKKVADIHMTPYDNREIGMARQASAAGRVKVERMEKELAAITSSAMKYKSFYLKSASQMAKEAMEAAETEAMASKKVKRTVVEESSRRQVAAA